MSIRFSPLRSKKSQPKTTLMNDRHVRKKVLLDKARLAAKKEAIFGGQYLVDISVRRPNIDQISPLQQEGKKYFAWFTTFKTQNVCIMLETNDNKKICRVEIANVCFHDELSYGTIVYGTMFKYDNTKCFSVEDIYYYKGKNISTQSYVNKLTIFKNIFSSEIKQISYFDNNIIFGLPLISNSFDEIVTSFLRIEILNKTPTRYSFFAFVFLEFIVL